MWFCQYDPAAGVSEQAWVLEVSYKEANVDAMAMLGSIEPSLLIIEKRSRSDIVIGVPHHAPAGMSTLPNPEHPDSDENAGFIGRHLAERLDCCSVIACNSTIDVNKHLDSEYAMRIIRWNPDILIEIHGHGKVRSKYDVEVSCGTVDQTGDSEALAAAINHEISKDAKLANVSVCGCFKEIYFKATKTLTITDPRWRAYHIELSSMLRKPGNGLPGKPTALAYRFCEYLADVLRARLA
jgi:hypothetical protein